MLSMAQTSEGQKMRADEGSKRKHGAEGRRLAAPADPLTGGITRSSLMLKTTGRTMGSLESSFQARRQK